MPAGSALDPPPRFLLCSSSPSHEFSKESTKQPHVQLVPLHVDAVDFDAAVEVHRAVANTDTSASVQHLVPEAGRQRVKT
jgi:hypothetical protein